MERLKNLLKNEAGAAFIMVLAATMVLYITAATFTVMITNQTKAIQAERNKQKAFYMAEAGLNRALVTRVRYPNKKNTNLNIGIPVPISFKDEDNKTVGTYQVKFEGVNKDTGEVYPAGHPDENLSDVKKITSTGVIEDTSGGSPVNIESVQSEYTQSPFNRDIWATGTVDFKSAIPEWYACAREVLESLFGWSYDSEVKWNVFGNLYSASQPTDDWCRQCCGYEIGCGTCVGFWLFGTCIGYLCECGVGETGCCVGWRQDMKARYATNQHLCGGYGGIGCSPDLGTAPNKYYWETTDTSTPFPQFDIPPDPRIPGSSSNLVYKTGSEVESCLKDPGADRSQCLSNVWVDGSVTIDRDAFDLIAVDGLWISGTTFINGSFSYQWESGAWLTAVCLRGEGTLIINQGDLRLWSAGSPNFGRVNIVLVNGDLELGSYCGMLTKGIYYAGGHTVDPITKKRVGGEIKIRGDRAFNVFDVFEVDIHELCDLAGDYLQGITGIAVQSYSEVYGATIGKDIKFEGATLCNVITNNPFAKPCGDKTYNIDYLKGNEDLRIPEGFWSTVRVYNWREEK